MGTHWGAVHILDFDGNLIKSWQNHSATVNDISIDNAEDYVATASDDGKYRRFDGSFKLLHQTHQYDLRI
jgi:WD40 repeat protein